MALQFYSSLTIEILIAALSFEISFRRHKKGNGTFQNYIILTFEQLWFLAWGIKGNFYEVLIRLMFKSYHWSIFSLKFKYIFNTIWKWNTKTSKFRLENCCVSKKRKKTISKWNSTISSVRHFFSLTNDKSRHSMKWLSNLMQRYVNGITFAREKEHLINRRFRNPIFAKLKSDNFMSLAVLIEKIVLFIFSFSSKTNER